MFKKYYVKENSEFNKSFLLSLLEKGEYGFHIEGLSELDYKELFSLRNIRFINNEVDVKSLPSRVEVTYLDDSLHLKVVVLSNKKNKYYLFKADHQNEMILRINQKYISSDLKSLLIDYESHSKTKGKINYYGEGDSSLIEDINYLENLYYPVYKSRLDNKSNIYQLIFENNNNFTADFAYLVNNQSIKIVNSQDIDLKVLSLESMRKNNSHRKDCLFINASTRDIEYFIFTYKSQLVNHYYLFKNIGNDNFLYIKEDISFNKILALKELDSIRFKKASLSAVKAFSKMRYDNFYNEYTSFEEEEEFEVDIISEFGIKEFSKEKAKIQLLNFIKEIKETFKNKKYQFDIGVTLHGQMRIKERIGELNDIEMKYLSKVAYEEGKNSVNYIESDPKMFKFLQYQQNKKRGKTLRLYKDILFFYSLEPPHDLVTCFRVENSLNLYLKTNK